MLNFEYFIKFLGSSLWFGLASTALRKLLSHHRLTLNARRHTITPEICKETSPIRMPLQSHWLLFIAHFKVHSLFVRVTWLSCQSAPMRFWLLDLLFRCWHIRCRCNCRINYTRKWCCGKVRHLSWVFHSTRIIRQSQIFQLLRAPTCTCHCYWKNVSLLQLNHFASHSAEQRLH